MRIAILSFTPIKTDGRVLRQIEYLSRHYAIDVIGYGDAEEMAGDNVRFFPLQPPTSLERRWRKVALLPLGRAVPGWAYERWYWHEREYQNALDILLGCRPNAIHANDWESLPVAVRAAQQTGAQVVADLHEYAPLLREDRRYWRTFYKPSVEYFLRQNLPQTAAMITVNQTLADRYHDDYGIQPIVVMNAPEILPSLSSHATEPQTIRLVHHGHANRDRNIELMVELMAHLDERFELHFMLLDRSPGYLVELKQLARTVAPERIHFHDPVAPSRIAERIAAYDLGVFFLPHRNFNQYATLPNKFFEFIAAGLAVCVGPSPEMARLIGEYQCGLVTPSFDLTAIADVLNRQGAGDIDRMKRGSVQARQVLNADNELGKLIALYDHLFAAISQ